jgi:hypothetical protein
VARAGLILAGLVFVLSVAACGGGGGGGGDETTTTTQGATTGQAILKKAGLEACATNTISGAGWVGTGLVQAQQAVVAADCTKAPKVPTTMSAYTFNTQENAGSSAAAAKKAVPNSTVFVPTVAPYTTTVVVLTGPNQKQYAVDIQQALPGG